MTPVSARQNLLALSMFEQIQVEIPGARRWVGGALVAMALHLGAGAASAQDKTGAAILAYDQAEKLMSEGKVGEACTKYEESQRLDAQLGTLLHLADCLEKNGRPASAWARFREAAELAEKRGDPRQGLASGHARALEPKLSKLQIDVPAGMEPAALHVERDKVAIESSLWGVAVPTDPGSYVITASAPGRRPWSSRVEVRADGSTTAVRIPELENDTGASTAASGVSSPAPAAPEPVTAEPSGGGVPWLAVGALAVGVGGVAVGTIFGLQSQSRRDESEPYCDGNTCWDQRGKTLRDDAISAGNISTIGFVVGGVGLAAGTVLWFTSRPSTSSNSAGFSPRIGLGPGMLRAEQSW